jgi:nucleotide-binding universal stress UspA family protein
MAGDADTAIATRRFKMSDRTDTDGRRDMTPAEVVVGVDGTYAAGEALVWAARLASSLGAGLTAVHAWQPGLGELSSGHDRAARRELRDLRRWCTLTKELGVDVRTVVTEGQPDDVLSEVARSSGDADPRLLVVGRASHGSGLAHDQDHLADHLARRLRTPLAVVPSPGAGRTLRRIVLGLDGSASGHAAAMWSAAVAKAIGADVAAVTIFEPIVEWVPRTDRSSMWSKVRQELEGPWTDSLRRRGTPFTADVLEGTNVAASLTQIARDRHADAIVIGLGHDVDHRLHPGTHLVDHCHLPVVLVPVGTTRAEDRVAQ